MSTPNPTFNASRGARLSDSARGTDPQALDRELPILLQDLYVVTDHRRAGTVAPEPTTPLPGGWSRMDDTAVRASGIDPALLWDPRSGFEAGLYRNASGGVVVGYAGTNEGQDWKHNLGQGLGFDDAQYASAIRLAREARVAFGNDVVLSGHSLGGGLAAAAAMASDTPAVTFNAAGVNGRTLEREGLDADAARAYAADGLIRGYHVKNELLTHLQEDSIPLRWAMPDAAGRQIELPDPDPLSFGQRLIPGRMLMHRLELHYIDAVINAQQLQQTGDAGRDGPAAASAALDASQLPGAGGRLYTDAVTHLTPQRAQLGLADDTAFHNAAAGVAARAGNDGLSRIDHLVANRDNSGVIAVEGGLGDPAQRRSAIDTAEAMATPAQQSASQLAQQEQARVAQPQQEEQTRQRSVG